MIGGAFPGGLWSGAAGVISVSFTGWEEVWATENGRCGGQDGEHFCTIWGRSRGWVSGGAGLVRISHFSCYALDWIFLQGEWGSGGGWPRSGGGLWTCGIAVVDSTGFVFGLVFCLMRWFYLMPMADLDVLSCGIDGLGGPHGRTGFLDFLRRRKIGVVLVQGSRLGEEDIHRCSVRWRLTRLRVLEPGVS